MFLRPWELKQYGCGGGVVRTAFRMGTQWVKSGTRLTADQIMSMNSRNRMALIERGCIAVWPKGGDEPISKGKRYAIHVGGGRYDVIEGRRLNEASLTREEAQTLTEGKTH